MRRKDREILDKREIIDVIKSCEVCNVGFYDTDNSEVYVVPLNFGYDEDEKALYFHGARKGRKYDLISKKPNVCFEMYTDNQIKKTQKANACTSQFRSVIGNGTIEEVTSYNEKVKGLNVIMFHYTGRDNWEYSDSDINSVALFKLKIEKLSSKFHE